MIWSLTSGSVGCRQGWSLQCCQPDGRHAEQRGADAVFTRHHGVADAALRFEYFLAGGGIAGEGGGGGPTSSRPVITVRLIRHIRTTTSMILCAFSIFIMTIELVIEDSQAAFGNKPCGSSTNLAAMPWSNWA